MIENLLFEPEVRKKQTWWARLVDAYDFRRWPFFVGFHRLHGQFGFDVMNYQALLGQLFLLYLIIYTCSLSLEIFYGIANRRLSVSTELNIQTLIDNVPFQPGRGLLWTAVLAMTALWARFVGYQRQYYSAIEGCKTHIEDVSVAVMNVPRASQDSALKVFLSRRGDLQLARYLRVGAPETIRFRKQLNAKLKQFHDMLGEFSDEIADDTTDPTLAIRLLQLVGYKRNKQYYWNAIMELQRKIKEVEATARVDALIVSYNSAQDAREAIRFINSNNFEGGAHFHAIKAPRPDDIYLENLVYEPRKQMLRYALTFTLVGLASLALFGLVCIFRYNMRNMKKTENGYQEEQRKYVLYFFLTYLSDGIFRPVLYWAQGFERHYSYSARESFWITKIYVYQMLNKLAMFYSRTVMYFGTRKITSFFDIFGYDADWRTQTNQGGQDAALYIWVVVVGYNFLDLGIFALYHVAFSVIAKTQREKLKALKSLPPRYASKYATQLIVLTFVLIFGHLKPSLSLQMLLYYPIQNVVSRFVLLRLAAQPVKSTVLTERFENFVYVAVLLAGGYLVQSYHQFTRRLTWLWALPVLCGVVVLCRVGALDWLMKRADHRFNFVLHKGEQKSAVDTAEMMEDGNWYQIDKPTVSEKDLGRFLRSQNVPNYTEGEL